MVGVLLVLPALASAQEATIGGTVIDVTGGALPGATLTALQVERSECLFAVAPDLGGEYSLAATDQRHRATVNGIWQVGRGFQVSGLYFFGSGQRFVTSYGGDFRQCGHGCDRLRPDRTIVPRNHLVGDPIHRVDVRLQQRFHVMGRLTLDGMLEAYNLLNHENFGSYEGRESNANYGKPIPLLSLAYQPRMLQLGFRASF